MLVVCHSQERWKSYLFSKVCLHRDFALYRALHKYVILICLYIDLDNLTINTNGITLYKYNYIIM